jgi:hypothetical protein
MSQPLVPPTQCPVTGEPMVITELQNESGTVTIRGKFAPLSTLERELGLSYPTIRARVDDLIESLGLTPFKESRRAKRDDERPTEILDALERGEISPEEAKTILKNKS